VSINVDYDRVIKCRSYRKTWKRLIHSLVFSYDYNLHASGLGKVIFFDTTRLKKRHDYELMADNFYGKLSDNVKDASLISIRYCLDISSVIKKIKMIFGFYIKENYNLYDAIQISQVLMLNELIDLLPNQIKKAITFCDAHPEDNFIAQSLREKSVRTYTLQHGYYVRNDSGINSEVYQNFVSDYMLCWGDSSVNNITQLEVDSRRLISFGCFKVKNNIDVNLNRERITLFLNGIHSSDENCKIISLYNSIKKMGVNVEVKIRRHPDDNNNYGLKEDVFDKLPLVDSLMLASYSVVLSSGVFVDLYLSNVPFSILKTENMPDEFKNLSHCSSESEILSNISQRNFSHMDDSKLIEQHPDWRVLS